jgi:hypothetical protein
MINATSDGADLIKVINLLQTHPKDTVIQLP